MRTQPGWIAISNGRPGEADRIADGLHGRRGPTKILLDDEPSSFDLGIGKHLVYPIDRSGRNALELESTQQIELPQGADFIAQDRNQGTAVPHAVGDRKS